ncbi:hypothetical protein [Nonomuraea sp. NPDC002799]
MLIRLLEADIRPDAATSLAAHDPDFAAMRLGTMFHRLSAPPVLKIAYWGQRTRSLGARRHVRSHRPARHPGHLCPALASKNGKLKNKQPKLPEPVRRFIRSTIHRIIHGPESPR